MFMKKFLANAGYLAPTPGVGGGGTQDVAHFEQEFDESVLEGDDTSGVDGSNFVGDDDADDRSVDPDDAAAARAAKAAKVKDTKPDKKPDDKPADKDDDPKTLADANAIAAKAKEDEEAAAALAAAGKKGPIPLDRHEAILAKMRDERDAAVRALANAQGGAKIVQVNSEIATLETEVDVLQDKYDAALIDGERETAKTLAKELRAKERVLGDKKTDIAVGIARAEAIETTRFDVAKERIEAAYPVLQPGHADYDQKVMDEVLELIDMYQMKGYTATDAMQKAVRKECGAPDNVAQAAATEVKPRVTEADADALLKDKRKENAVDKALKTVQPPSTEKVGLDNDKLGRTKTSKDIVKLTDAEFDALTDEELAKMGGDFRVVEESQE